MPKNNWSGPCEKCRFLGNQLYRNELCDVYICHDTLSFVYGLNDKYWSYDLDNIESGIRTGQYQNEEVIKWYARQDTHPLDYLVDTLGVDNLGPNYNGYPLEDLDESIIHRIKDKHEFRRFYKNLNYSIKVQLFCDVPKLNNKYV